MGKFICFFAGFLIAGCLVAYLPGSLPEQRGYCKALDSKYVERVGCVKDDTIIHRF